MLRLLKNTAGITAARATEAVVSFVLLAVFTRVFSDEEFGTIAILQIYASIVSILIDGRLNTAFSIRFYQDTPEIRSSRIYLVQCHNLVLGLAFLLIPLLCPRVLLWLLQLPADTSPAVLFWVQLLALLRVLFSFFTNLLIIEKSAGRFLAVTLLTSLTYLLANLIYFIYLQGHDYTFYFQSHVLAQALGLAVAIPYYFARYPLPVGRVKFFHLRELLLLGLPLIPAGMISYVQNSADRYMLSAFGFLGEAGIYSVATRFPTIGLTLILVPFGQAVTPYLLKRYAQSPKAYAPLQRVLTSLACALSMVLAGLGGLAIVLAFPFIVGPGFQSALPVTLLLFLNLWAASLAQSFAGPLLVLGRTRTTLKITFLSALLNILYNLLFIPKWLALGAAGATLLASISQAFLTLFYCQKALPIRYSASAIGLSAFGTASTILFLLSCDVDMLARDSLGLLELGGTTLFILLVSLVGSCLIGWREFARELCAIDGSTARIETLPAPRSSPHSTHNGKPL